MAGTLFSFLYSPLNIKRKKVVWLCETNHSTSDQRDDTKKYVIISNFSLRFLFEFTGSLHIHFVFTHLLFCINRVICKADHITICTKAKCYTDKTVLGMHLEVKLLKQTFYSRGNNYKDITNFHIIYVIASFFKFNFMQMQLTL